MGQGIVCKMLLRERVQFTAQRTKRNSFVRSRKKLFEFRLLGFPPSSFR
jgi:hypothetical protein